MKIVVPFTLLIIFLLRYLSVRRIDETLLVMATPPFALVGSMIIAPLLSMQIISSAYILMWRRSSRTVTVAG